MNRYLVYKKRQNGGFMYITSILSETRNKAIDFVDDPKQFGGFGKYYVTGLSRDYGEDLMSNMPFHINKRIENKGIKVKSKGYLYEYKVNPRRSQTKLRPKEERTH